ncbi:MAG: gliding motility-associated C-terminal domain-containing protein [Bacteroidota bacterium]
MPARSFKLLFLLLTFFLLETAYAQQDIDFHLSNTFLSGKNILKVKRDFNDPYLWVLTQNNEVYRINSETLVVDDYTSKFAAYNNLPFVDIAGNSKDDVFIAQSDKVIRYLNNTITTITSADGLRGNVTNIGFGYRLYDNYDTDGTHLVGPTLIISSDIVTDYYYTTTKRFLHNETEHKKYSVKVATYKSTMMFNTEKDSFWQFQEDTYEVFSTVYQGLYVGYIYLEPQEFGSQLKATYYNGWYDYYSANFSYLGNQYWATEKGLFQNKWDNSQNPAFYGYHHYLENNHINQISSMFGLVSFGSKNIRENMLVATDEGLYVSNSKLYPQQVLPTYEFYHYAGLGNKKINYIDVNAFATRVDINTELNLVNDYCENGVWVGATDGLYLLKPDYTNYFDQNQNLPAISFDGQPLDQSIIDLCPGVTAKANLYINTNASIQWYKNGQELANQSNKTLEINSAGEYYATLYDPCTALHVNTNHLTVNYLNGTPATLNYPDKINVCFGSSTQLKVPANPDFQYRWYKDGVLNGITTPEINITESGKYKLEVNSCPGNWVSTKEVDVNFIKIPLPIVTPDKTIICEGEEATLSASVPVDATGILNWLAYTYRWYKDGVLLPATTAIIKATATGKYKVEATACAGNSAVSAELQINVISLPTPQITSAKDVYCESETALLNTNFLADPNYTINWYKDNVLMPANINKTSISVSTGGSYYCSITSKLTASVCQKDAPAKLVTFVPGPTYTFNYDDVLTRCAGEIINLQIQGSLSYKYRWYKNGVLTGQTSNAIDVTQAGKYKADVSVCENSWVTTKEVEVKFIQLPAPVIIANKTGYCIGDNANLNINIPLNPDYTINWYVDGNPVSGWLNKNSITTSANGVYTVKVNSNLISCEQVSTPKQIIFSPKPEISIEKIVKTSLCDGQSVDLIVNLTGGSIKWSTGETTSKISVTHSGNYKAVYTSAGGCETEAETNLVLFQNPVLNLFDGVICAFKNETITLTAPVGFASYKWNNGESVSSTFMVNKPQTVTLTVTDANNCQATQQIQIKNQCPDVHLANTFTPNGDGINDTWLVTGIEDDPTVNVKVFNRGGSLVFESKGYTKAWDGTFNGKRLNAGVYYYIITTEATSEILKGSVTILF